MDVGERNLTNFVRSGYDHIHVTPNEEIMRKINKLGFIKMGFPYYGWLISIYSLVELFLAFYFLFGIYASFKVVPEGDFGLFLFHIALFIGFSSISYHGLKQSI